VNTLVNSKKMVPTYVGLALSAGIAVTAMSWVCFFALIFPLAYAHGLPAIAVGFATGVPLVLAAITLPFVLRLVRRTPIKALGRYHWILFLSVLLTVFGFVALFNMPLRAHSAVKVIYAIIATYFFALGALLYSATHFKIAIRIAGDKDELKQLNLFWLVITAIVAMFAIVTMFFWEPLGRQNILNIIFVSATVMLVASSAIFFGTYNYVPRIEAKEIGVQKQNYPKVLFNDFKTVVGTKKLFFVGMVLCLFALLFCAVLVSQILMSTAQVAGLRFGTQIFLCLGIVSFGFAYFLGYKLPPKNITNATKRCSVSIILCALYFALLLFISMLSSTPTVVAIIVGFAITPIIGLFGGFSMSAISAHWTFLSDGENVIKGEIKQLLSYITITCIAGLALIIGGVAVSLNSLGRHGWITFIIVAFVSALTGVILLIIALKKQVAPQDHTTIAMTTNTTKDE